MKALPLISVLLLAACNGHGGSHDATSPADGSRPHNYAGIGAGETLHFAGTEPFWNGSVNGSTLRYATPDAPEGAMIAVHRFAGNNGLSFSGALGDTGFDMAVTEAPCSDGMSDRSYPFTVSLQLGAEKRQGCGWTDKRQFAGPAKP